MKNIFSIVLVLSSYYIKAQEIIPPTFTAFSGIVSSETLILQASIGDLVADKLENTVIELAGGIESLSVIVVDVDDALSVRDNATTYEVYPNPTSERITISHAFKGDNTFLVLTDLKGNVLLKQPLSQATTTLDLRSYNSGIYFLRITERQGPTSTLIKLIKN